MLGYGKACGDGRLLKWLLASLHTTGSPATCSMGSRNEAKQQNLSNNFRSIDFSIFSNINMCFSIYKPTSLYFGLECCLGCGGL